MNIMQRASLCINKIPTRNFHHATNYAEKIGVPLNYLITINLWETGLDAETSSLAFREILNRRYAPWLRRTVKAKHPPTYVWVAEAPHSNVGVHLLIHISSTDLEKTVKMFWKWVVELATQELPNSTIKVSPVSNIVGVKKYLQKGTNEAYAKMVGIRHVPQGRIFGRRSGFSKNLGPTARRKSGYQSRPFADWSFSTNAAC